VKAPADEDLREAVRAALAGDRDTAGLTLRVGVLHAVVHLGGQAPSARLRHRAEAVAAGVAGVRGVANRIEAPGGPSPARTVNLSPHDEGNPNRYE
jgi:osmotically-inducible protein OsmY